MSAKRNRRSGVRVGDLRDHSWKGLYLVTGASLHPVGYFTCVFLNDKHEVFEWDEVYIMTDELVSRGA